MSGRRTRSVEIERDSVGRFSRIGVEMRFEAIERNVSEGSPDETLACRLNGEKAESRGVDGALTNELRSDLDTLDRRPPQSARLVLALDEDAPRDDAHRRARR